MHPDPKFSLVFASFPRLGNIFIIIIIIQLSGSSLKCSTSELAGASGSAQLSPCWAVGGPWVQGTVVSPSYLDFTPEAGPSRGHNGLLANNLHVFSSPWVLWDLPGTVHPLISFPKQQHLKPNLSNLLSQPTSWFSHLFVNHHHSLSHSAGNWSHLFISSLPSLVLVTEGFISFPSIPLESNFFVCLFSSHCHYLIRRNLYSRDFWKKETDLDCDRWKKICKASGQRGDPWYYDCLTSKLSKCRFEEPGSSDGCCIMWPRSSILAILNLHLWNVMKNFN